MTDTIKHIGWIGTGVMGGPMAEHLLDAGYKLKVYTRTKEKAATLLNKGAFWADSPAEAANGMDVAISIVGFPEDVKATHLGCDGTLTAESPPSLIVDMTTSQPSLAKLIYKKANEQDVGSIDAPVSGGDVGAKNARLSIMVGADENDFSRIHPVFAILGKTIVRQGGAGAGQHTKMVNQILIASTMMGACEGLLYARKTGLDPTTVLKSVGSGAAGSWTISNLGPRMIKRDFNPGFFVEHFIKDLGIALEEAEKLNLTLPGLSLAKQYYEVVNEQGHGKLGTQALLLAMEKLNNLEYI